MSKTTNEFTVTAFSNPMPGRTVHVSVPVSAAFSVEKMQKVTATVLERLGHPGCHSGFDFRFIHETDFRFNEHLELMR